jgi:hypothetical protein
MNIEKENILIAEWLGWKEGYPHIRDKYGNQCVYGFDTPFEREYENSNDADNSKYYIPYSELKFHSDSNWQWLCLEKIALNENVKIGYVILHILKLDSNLNSKQDLFEAIINYIKNQKV